MNVAAGTNRWPDGASGLGLFLLAFLVGTLYCRAFEGSHTPPEPWVKELGAAVAFACGHGYVDPGYEPSQAVASFLDKKIDRISCEDLPRGGSVQPPNFTQSLYRYMTLAAGLTWAVAGISWMQLALLLGLLHAASVAASYGIFRLAVNRLLAAAGALIMMVSPLQLRFLPQLRDYAKAPFILTLIFILGLLVVRPFSRRRLLALAAAYGAVMGIGFGFRNDLLINMLPFFATVALFLPVPLRSQLRVKLAAVALCIAVFAVCAWPIIRAYRSGSNTGHVVVLGLMTAFNGSLGITGSVYDWGAAYDDGFAIKTISSFAERVEHRRVSALSNEYDRAAFEYLLLIGRHWPADLLIRAYGSVLRIIELPFQVRSYAPAIPPAIADGLLGRLYSAWDAVWSRLSGIGLAVAAFAVLTVASVSVRIAVWFLAALLYFAAYPVVQFDARHFFFLEFIPWLALAVTCEGLVGVLTTFRNVRAGGTFSSHIVARGRGVLAVGIGTILTLGTPIVALRAYQQQHVTELLDTYIAATTETLSWRRAPIDARRVLLLPNASNESTLFQNRVEYLVVDVARRNCAQPLAPITFRYETASGYTDLSQRIYVPVPQNDAPFRLFFPAYYSAGQHFVGLEVTDRDEGCVAAVRRIERIDRTPILLNLLLPPDWREMKLYQTLTDWERPSAPYRVRVYAWPRTLDPARSASIATAPPPVSALDHSALVVSDARGWVVRGTVWASTSFLARLSERSVSKGASFVVRGTLYRGGFTLGLLQNDLWTTSVNVVAPGDFLAIVEAPADGPYVPALANFLTGVNRRNDFVITAAGWADPDRAASPARGG
jgi:hypothetical protein